MQPRIFVLVLVLCGAAVVWWAAAPADDPVPPWTSPVAVAPTPGKPVGNPAGTPAPGPELPPGAPHVAVALQLELAYLQPPPAPVVAIAADGRSALPVQVVAGVGARHLASAGPRAGLSLLWVLAGEAEQHLRRVAIVPGEPAELRLGPRRLVRGKVEAAGKPVAEASIWLGEADGRGEFRLAATDGDGRFELDVPSGDGIPFVVRHPGYASHCQWVAVDPRSPAELAAALVPAEPLTVQLVGEATALVGARLWLVPRAPVASELSSYPFFLQTLQLGHRIDERGRVVIPDLPGKANLGVVVLGQGRPVPASVEVTAAARRAPVLLPVAGAAIQTIAAELALPELGPVLAVLPPAGGLRAASSSLLLPDWVVQPGSRVSIADDQGRLQVAELGAEAPPLQLWATGHAGLALDAAARQSAARHQLPAWPDLGEPALRLLPPVGGSPWSCSCSHLPNELLRQGPDEAVLVAVPPGRYTIELVTSRGGVEVNRQRHPGLVVLGPFELPSPPP
jgi:hypothetical protein